MRHLVIHLDIHGSDGGAKWHSAWFNDNQPRSPLPLCLSRSTASLLATRPGAGRGHRGARASSSRSRNHPATTTPTTRHNASRATLGGDSSMARITATCRPPMPPRLSGVSRLCRKAPTPNLPSADAFWPEKLTSSGWQGGSTLASIGGRYPTASTTVTGTEQGQGLPEHEASTPAVTPPQTLRSH